MSQGIIIIKQRKFRHIESTCKYLQSIELTTCINSTPPMFLCNHMFLFCISLSWIFLFLCMHLTYIRKGQWRYKSTQAPRKSRQVTNMAANMAGPANAKGGSLSLIVFLLREKCATGRGENANEQTCFSACYSFRGKNVCKSAVRCEMVRP